MEYFYQIPQGTHGRGDKISEETEGMEDTRRTRTRPSKLTKLSSYILTENEAVNTRSTVCVL